MGKGQAAPKRTGHQEKTMANDRANVKKTNELFHQAGPTMESKRKKESGKTKKQLEQKHNP